MTTALKRRSAKRVPSEALRLRAAAILKDLDERYPDATCELDYTSPHELLVATILSAQATDVGVNKATPALFAAFPAPADYAAAGVDRVAPYLRTLNFWRMKAKAVVESMRVISERHRGEVPRTMDELLQLRGVARKTANVVLGTAFGINEGVVVDTHVLRLAKRFGLTRSSKPGEVERHLMALFPRDRWCDLSHKLILHGRRVCKARGGACATDSLCRRWCRDAASPRSAKPTPPRRARPTGSPSSRRARS